uniref:guanylate kinase n=1 Tax=Acidithiobacillus sp. TaxID=1872118 RepID=UPI002608D15B
LAFWLPALTAVRTDVAAATLDPGRIETARRRGTVLYLCPTKALAADPRFGISVSHTTRAPRPGEQDGVHYHFVDHAAFARLVTEGAFLEHAQVFGNRYGTTRAAVESLLREGRHVILDIDWQGARRIKALWPEALAIFILPPSLAALEARLRGRGQDDESVIAERMAKARAEIAHAGEFDHVIVNDEFEEALADLKTLIAEGKITEACEKFEESYKLEPLLGALLNLASC